MTGTNLIREWGRSIARVVCAAVLATTLSGQAGRAQTLADALVSAYETSGLIEQNRALLRAADEGVANAVAALRPIINYTADITRTFGDRQGVNPLTGFGTTTNLEGTQASAGIVAELLLYDGGATVLSRESAKEIVLATRQQLISSEQTVLFRAVQAYLNVAALREFLELRRNNLRLLSQELQAAQDRFEVGEVTRTDVAQAESRLADARSGLATAQGDLLQAAAEYRSVVGREPGALAPPPRQPQITRSLEVARAFAVRNHPDLLAAQHQVASAELNVRRAEAALTPSISANAGLSVSDGTRGNDYSRSGSIGLSLSGPIYQGGGIASSIRRAMASRDAQRGDLLEVRRRIEQNVGNAYASLSSERASLVASEERIRAAQIAFDGVREEASLGARTTLDVLDAEQELLDARTARISAEANVYIAAYAVLESMGRLTTEQLNLGVQSYDPAAYYNLVKDAPIPWSKQGRQLDKVLRSLQRQ